MNKKIIFLLTCLICLQVQASLVLAQDKSTDEVAVQQVIENLFDGMRGADSAMVASAFAEGAIMQTISQNQAGETIVRGNAVAAFTRSIAAQNANTLDERIQDYEIRIDGNLASVWTPYSFYFDGNFSHCGVNSFQLVRMAEGWKIVYLIDTRRKEGCE